MSSQTKVLGFSVPKKIADEYEQLAKSEHKTKSELFREMVRKYQESRRLEVFHELQKYGVEKAIGKGVKTEQDIMRLIHEARGV